MSSLPLVLELLNSSDHAQFSTAVEQWVGLASPAEIATFARESLAGFESGLLDNFVRSEVISSLVMSPFVTEDLTEDDSEVVRALLHRALLDEDWIVRGWAAIAFAGFGIDADIPRLKEVALNDDEPYVCLDAVDSLYRLDPEVLEGIVNELLNRSDEDLIVQTIVSLYAIALGKKVSFPACLHFWDDQELVARVLRTLRTLVQLGSSDEALLRLAREVVASLKAQGIPPGSFVDQECEELLAELR